MDFQTSILWAFQVAPSQLPTLFWQYSFRDLETFCRQKIEEELVRSYQTRAVLRSALFDVATAALGGKSKGSSSQPITRTSDLIAAVKATGGLVN